MAQTDTPETGPPKGYGPMARREMRLAYGLLAPTFLIVLAIVLGPLLANFWISVKPVQLGDLRAPSLVVSERLRGELTAPGDRATLEYRVRNSSRERGVANARFVDTVPPGLLLVDLPEQCAADGTTITCELGNLDGAYRDRLPVTFEATADYLANPVNPRDSKPITYGRGENVLTNAEFTGENFARVFSSDEFWHVLRVSLYYTVFGTAGALVLGLFAAQLLNTSFRGRNLLRGLFLFPYVAPVIAVAFTWVVLLDPLSGTLNAILQQMGLIAEPINFFGLRSVPMGLFGLSFDFPVALTTVIAFEAWRYFPLSFLFILARMQSIPSDMFEAAEIDGATPFQQFWYLGLPQLMGILAGSVPAALHLDVQQVRRHLLADRGRGGHADPDSRRL